jgi:putative intracellular protease/amidase
MEKRLVLLVAILAVCMPLMAGAAPGKQAVLLIARGETTVQDIGISGLRLMIQEEVMAMVHQLEEAGYAVVIASASGQKIKAGDIELNVDKKFADIDVQDYVGIVVPCMGEADHAIPPKAVELIRAAYARNIPIAAQQSGVELLGAADILKGKKFAIASYLQSSIKEGQFVGTGVVEDGLIITSGTCPYMAKNEGGKDGTVELMKDFVELLR